jgi:hypothetical protein
LTAILDAETQKMDSVAAVLETRRPSLSSVHWGLTVNSISMSPQQGAGTSDPFVMHDYWATIEAENESVWSSSIVAKPSSSSDRPVTISTLRHPRLAAPQAPKDVTSSARQLFRGFQSQISNHAKVAQGRGFITGTLP